MDWRGLLYADKPKCRKAAPSKNDAQLGQLQESGYQSVFGHLFLTKYQ